jgi:cell division protein FtsB
MFLYARRFAVNAVVLSILGSFAYLLVFLSNTYSDSENLGSQIAAPLAASGGTTILPILFFMLGAQEKWDRPSIGVSLG